MWLWLVHLRLGQDLLTILTLHCDQKVRCTRRYVLSMSVLSASLFCRK